MRVVVLMSTYNGERFVRQQVESILAQLPPHGRLIVRDDGSRDGTADLVEGFADARIVMHRGANLGFVRSFFALLALVPSGTEMVMLSDQDDVWLPHKIERAWAAIGPAGELPTLYCSRLALVSPELQPLGHSPTWPRPPGFQNALTENIVTGCTCALNPAALRLLRDPGDAGRIFFHDWWFYLVVSAFGRVVYDPQPTILYRQHGANAIGMGEGLARYAGIVRFLRKTNWVHICFDQIANFRAVHGARLSAEQTRLLDRCFDPRHAASVARLVFAPRRLRQTLAGDVLFRGLVLANVLTGRGLLPRRD
ncbi:glycosyltransferase family 2 protein [Ramlibacter sp.]|uniref:glycosyltransferase family 2 protein n=1 Tax=Ramlibacter sp. TaxID=1917967 RepID=UPI003D0D9CF2